MSVYTRIYGYYVWQVADGWVVTKFNPANYWQPESRRYLKRFPTPEAAKDEALILMNEDLKERK